VLDTLKAIAAVRHEPQWRVLSDAVSLYVERLPDEERRLLTELMQRAGPVLKRPTRAPGAVTAPALILNVDDNDAMRFARTRMLEAEGYRVIEAPTGRAALELLERHKVAIVLLDVNLPDMNGTDVLLGLKADASTADVPVAIVSADTTYRHADQLLASGASAVLAKPLDRQRLAQTLDSSQGSA
jgi:CheY-like chemotaxis protein